MKNEHKLGFLNLIVDAVSKQGRRPFGNNFIQFSSLSFVNRVSKITTDSKYNHLWSRFPKIVPPQITLKM